MNSNLLRISFVVLLAWMAPLRAASASAPAADWKIGLGRADLTPERPVRLAGYATRPPRPFSSVDGRLFAKVMVLEDQSGRRAALVTADLINLKPDFTEPLLAEIQRRTGLTREQVLINVAHNHTSPVLSLDPRPSDNFTGTQGQETIAYTKRVQRLIAETVAAAAANVQPARLSWSVGVATFVMNRREHRTDRIAIGFNPRGYVDRSVPVMRIEHPDGSLRAILFGAAAHNTTVAHNGPDGLMLTPEYAGYAQAYVEAEHPGVQAMFMLGFAGDANPFPRGTADVARQHGRTLAGEVARVLTGSFAPIGGPLRTEYATVQLPFDTSLTREQLEERARPQHNDRNVVAAATEILARRDRGETLPQTLAAPLAVWQFGDDLTLVGVAGEIVSDYVGLMEQALGPRNLWLAGYCNSVFGYLASARNQAEGGYEAKGIFGQGFFGLEAQDVLVDKVRELAIRAGREVPPNDRKHP